MLGRHLANLLLVHVVIVSLVEDGQDDITLQIKFETSDITGCSVGSCDHCFNASVIWNLDPLPATVTCSSIELLCLVAVLEDQLDSGQAAFVNTLG